MFTLSTSNFSVHFYVLHFSTHFWFDYFCIPLFPYSFFLSIFFSFFFFVFFRNIFSVLFSIYFFIFTCLLQISSDAIFFLHDHVSIAGQILQPLFVFIIIAYSFFYALFSDFFHGTFIDKSLSLAYII